MRVIQKWWPGPAKGGDGHPPPAWIPAADPAPSGAPDEHHDRIFQFASAGIRRCANAQGQSGSRSSDSRRFAGTAGRRDACQRAGRRGNESLNLRCRYPAMSSRIRSA
jgi:hypothetical protein